MDKVFWLRVGCVSAAASVALGAFGAHALKDIDPALKKTWETAAAYHMYHSLGLLLAAAIARPASSAAHWSLLLFAAGILLFSGSLYALVLSRVRILGAITPIGGLAFIAAWLCLASASFN
eukprot:TRINITY_DN5344_c0_g1_i1.p1 TRINITY_DN5344_c0_g1~~TRINITY_DN5344_c0_g1_i1.p1  ORF type:complete len:138 (-),score=19.83 TRINITY_DN5344_c0_g1_i1:221-583(-)